MAPSGLTLATPPLGAPRARPDWAARAALTASSGSDLGPYAKLALHVVIVWHGSAMGLVMEIDERVLAAKFEAILPHLDERAPC